MKIEIIDRGEGKWSVRVDDVAYRDGAANPDTYTYHQASLIARAAISTWWKAQDRLREERQKAKQA